MKYVEVNRLETLVDCIWKKYWYDVPNFPDRESVDLILYHIFIISKLNITFFSRVLVFNGIVISA